MFGDACSRRTYVDWPQACESQESENEKRIPSFVGEPRRCDGECGNDERRDSCCKCAVVPRHTSVIRKASLGRQARVTSFPGEGALRHSAACASMERSWSCRSMTFFSNHAMVMDWEMTSRSRWSAAASLANDCASVMICGSAFHRAMARSIRLLPTIFGLRPALAKMLVGPLPRKYCAMQRTWNSLE